MCCNKSLIRIMSQQERNAALLNCRDILSSLVHRLTDTLSHRVGHDWYSLLHRPLVTNLIPFDKMSRYQGTAPAVNHPSGFKHYRSSGDDTLDIVNGERGWSRTESDFWVSLSDCLDPADHWTVPHPFCKIGERVQTFIERRLWVSDWAEKFRLTAISQLQSGDWLLTASYPGTLRHSQVRCRGCHTSRRDSISHFFCP